MRLIDADALIADMSEKHRPNFHEDLKAYHMWIMWYWAIKNAPTIEPKRGEWIEREVIDPIGKIMPMEQWQSARCSICGKYHTTPYRYYFDNYNFCPNCGARMTERSE